MIALTRVTVCNQNKDYCVKIFTFSHQYDIDRLISTNIQMVISGLYLNEGQSLNLRANNVINWTNDLHGGIEILPNVLFSLGDIKT